MRSTVSMLIFSFAFLVIAQLLDQSHGLALIALATRPTFLVGRFMKSNVASVAGSSDETVSAAASAFAGSIQVDDDASSFGFDADAYRREMLNLVYDRSMDRLVK